MSKRKSYLDEDGEAPELDEQFFREARPIWDFPDLVRDLERAGKLGRPPLPEGQKKQRVTMYLDPEVVARLKQEGRGWQTRANAALRKALGL